MLDRQKILLHLIKSARQPVSRLRLVKWAFLFGAEYASLVPTFYQFVPYRYGPFSFTLYHEIDALIANGYLTAPSSKTLTVARHTRALDMALDEQNANAVRHFLARYGEYSTRHLLDTVYTRYPWFTLNSNHPARRAVARPQAQCAVYTVGYAGLSVDGFLNLLLESGIRRVLDVRHNPISRRYGFHKTTLARLCEHLDIEYRHLPELGIPSAWRTGLTDVAAYARLLARYETHILSARAEAIHRVADLIQTLPSVLVCQEADPACCHRSRLAARVSTLTGLPILDLRRKA